MRTQVATYVAQMLTRRGIPSRAEAVAGSRWAVRVGTGERGCILWLGDAQTATDAVVFDGHGAVVRMPRSPVSASWTPDDLVEELAALSSRLAPAGQLSVTGQLPRSS